MFSSSKMSRKIIDSHIHLFDKSHLDQLAWMNESSPLNDGQDLVRYSKETDVHVEGVVFIETDRKVGDPIDDLHSWDCVLNEYAYIDRILREDLLPIENSEPLPEVKLLAAVPWAPVPAGPEVLDRFIQELKLKAPNTFDSIKGFRYLVQDKPKGVMLEEKFIKGVEFLGQNGFIFELGIDMRSGGLWQLREAIEFAKKVPNTVLIIGK